MNLRLRYYTSLDVLEKECAQIGCDLAGIKIMNKKGIFLTIKVEAIQLRAAIILKQEMMALGGEVVLSRDVMTLKLEKTDTLIMGTEKQYQKLIQKLYQQPFGCKELAEQLKKLLEKKICTNHGVWNLGNKLLDFTKPTIMGIINITPDSFSDGGKFLNTDAAIAHAKQLIGEGADMLDLGAESSRPGSDPVSAEEELERLLPVLCALKNDQTITIPISIDTTKAEVAKICLKHGANIINDITGMQDPAMRNVAAQKKVPVIMMHMQGTPKTMQENPQYKDVVDDIITFFEKQIAICEQEGITQIICDPGIGFGKTVEHNLQILKRLREFNVLGKPLLVGTSRKSFINKTIGGEPNDRLEGTIASNVVACMNGAHIFRVHDVKACKRALDLTNLIKNGEKK